MSRCDLVPLSRSWTGDAPLVSRRIAGRQHQHWGTAASITGKAKPHRTSINYRTYSRTSSCFLARFQWRSRRGGNAPRVVSVLPSSCGAMGWNPCESGKVIYHLEGSLKRNHLCQLHREKEAIAHVGPGRPGRCPAVRSRVKRRKQREIRVADAPALSSRAAFENGNRIGRTEESGPAEGQPHDRDGQGSRCHRPGRSNHC